MFNNSDDDESVFDRLWCRVRDRIPYISPVWIIPLRETLTIIDYRPTLLMFLTTAGFVFFAGCFVLLVLKIEWIDWFGLWAIGIFALICLAFSLRGTIRETYYFDKVNNSYALVRQFVYRKEVIEGALSQFTGAYVETQENDESESYFVMLKQEGMFLAGVSEQTLIEVVPIFNSFNNEARIANAIDAFLHSKS